MISGTTRADAAILVVDAAEGPLAQTYLHAYLIAMLGIEQVVLVVNKMDLVHFDRGRFDRLAHQLSAHLARLGIEPAAVVPASAQQGDNITQPSDHMPWNTGPTLVEVLENLRGPDRRERQPLRFIVQCPFETDGRRATLGRVISGRLRCGQPIVFGPAGHETTVSSIFLGQEQASEAVEGQCVGLLLESSTPIDRGQVAFERDHAPLITDWFAAKVFWISERPLQLTEGAEILCGTQTRTATIESIVGVIDPVLLEPAPTSATRLEDSQVAEVTIRTDEPVCVDTFDAVPEAGRFALLQHGRIAGGGVIVG